MKKIVPLFLALAGCTTAPNYTAMTGFIGMPIGRVIISNGPPETRVRLDAKRVAYTFHKRNDGISGSGGYISSYTLDCRFTFIVNETGPASTDSIIADVQDPGASCR